MRQRTSSLRLVSCVEVASSVGRSLQLVARVARVELVDAQPEVCGRVADLVERDEHEVAVARGVLHALGHGRRAELLQAEHQVALREVHVLVGGGDVLRLAEHEQVGDEVEQPAVDLGRVVLRGACRAADDRGVDRGRRRRARVDVGAVHRDGRDQLDDRVAHLAVGVVALGGVGVADVGEQAGEPLDVADQRGAQDLALALQRERREVAPAGR